MGAQVTEVSPQDARKALTAKPLADKIEVAEHPVAKWFPQLREKLPRRPSRAVLGVKSGDKYWLHAFDALALAAVVPSENR